MRVATYNFKGLNLDVSALVRVLRDIDVDVVAVQEPPRGLRGGAALRGVAHEAGLEVVVAGGYPLGGVTTALLARPEVAARVRNSGARTLPFDVWRWIPVWAKGLRWPSRRGFCFLDLGEYVVLSVHLGLNASERIVHRNIVLNTIKSLGPKRCVVAGDLNELPGGDSWRALERPLRDAVSAVADNPSGREFATFPAHRPTKRIDAIFVGDDIEVEAVHVNHGHAAKDASDHLPLIARLT